MMALPLVLMTEEEVASYGRNDGGFGALKTERGLLPLTAMEIDARVSGVIASIVVAQTFVNTTGVAIEATYMFPLPDRAAVHRFRMEVAGRVTEGVIEERGVAREQYDQAIAAGHRAAITEEERPGTFTLRVGNLMPGESATVRISLVGPLPIDDGEVTFRFPLVIAPRYMPGTGLGGDQAGLGVAEDTNLVPDASRISPPVLLPGCPNPVRLGIRVALEDASIREVASSLHAITTSLRDARVIEARPGERLDRDFILRWNIGGADLRSTLVCADDGDGWGTFMLTLVPPSTKTAQAKPRDVMFVIDRSGSMEGWKMVAARRALARMIDTLTSRDRFGVVAFDGEIEMLPERGLVDATDRNRYRAVEALAKIGARGGTEIEAPLRHAVQALAGGHDDRNRVVVLVTDGQVGNEDHILREITPNLRNVRVFTLGIDQAVNAGFLRRLAGAGGGLCELVESEDRLDEVMAKVHRRIGTPIATELAIRATGLDVDTWTIAPNKLPDVYAGSPVVVLGRYRGVAATGATIDIEGTSLGDPLRLSIAREPQLSKSEWLAASWARAHIRELEDRYATGVHTVEAEIVTTSKRFGVLSRFTAFLAVDRSEVANPGGKVRQVVQPVEAPAGWESSGGAANTKLGVARHQAPPQMISQAQHAPVTSRSVTLGAPRPTEAMPMPMAMPPPMAPMASGPSRMRPSPARPAGAMPPRPRLPAEEHDDAADQSIAPPASDRMISIDGAYENEARSGGRSGSFDASFATPQTEAYRGTLIALAKELAIKVTSLVAIPTSVRLIRQRLTEWVEDLRSIGGQEVIALEVEALIKRLSAALATPNLSAEALAVSGELIRIASGGLSPKPARPAFWK